jgi:hypothetical protein
MLKFSSVKAPTLSLAPVLPKFTIQPSAPSVPGLSMLPKTPPSLMPVSSKPPTFVVPAEDVDGGGVSGVKVAVGLGVAALVIGAIVVATRSGGSAVPNRQYKTSAKKREYMKGYRAGRKFCG